ncbi:MAG TPA: transposase [Verrucomicrobiae bacterium]
MALDVEVRSGWEQACLHGLSNLWRVWDRLTPSQRPWLVCGDANYGNERLMAQCEERGQKYLFRQRGTKGVGQLVRWLEGQGGWQPLREGWSGAEGELQLTGWTRQRRTVVLRRQRPPPSAGAGLPLLAEGGVEVVCGPVYEYVVLATRLQENLLTLAHLYRQRADVENAYDELKNQWGWGGFTTRDLLRCQIAARMAALVYNWWNLFVRCAEPERAREPSPVAPCYCMRWAAWSKRRPDHPATDQPTRPSPPYPKHFEQAQSLSQRADQCCGAVAAPRTLAADLATHPGTLSSADGRLAGSRRLKSNGKAQNIKSETSPLSFSSAAKGECLPFNCRF